MPPQHVHTARNTTKYITCIRHNKYIVGQHISTPFNTNLQRLQHTEAHGIHPIAIYKHVGQAICPLDSGPLRKRQHEHDHALARDLSKKSDRYCDRSAQNPAQRTGKTGFSNLLHLIRKHLVVFSNIVSPGMCRCAKESLAFLLQSLTLASMKMCSKKTSSETTLSHFFPVK